MQNYDYNLRGGLVKNTEAPRRVKSFQPSSAISLKQL
jgi:hypothetical protein